HATERAKTGVPVGLRNGSSPAPAQQRRSDSSPAQPVRPGRQPQQGKNWEDWDEGEVVKLSSDAVDIINEAFRRLKTRTGEAVLYVKPDRMKEHAEFGNLLSNAKQRLYNMFGQQDMKTYLESKAMEWKSLGDLVDGAGEGCYCEEHGVIMLSPHGDKKFRERCLAVCLAAAKSQKNGWGAGHFKNEAFKLIVGIAFQEPETSRVPLPRKRRAIKAEAESPATPAVMSGAYEEEEGDIAEAAAIEDWNLPPHVFEGEDGEEAPAQETRDPDPVQDDDAVLEIQELKRKNVALLGELEEKERTIEELRKQKAEQEAAYSGLKDDLEEAVEGQKIAQNAYTQKEQEAEATKRELESAKKEAESAKKEAENTAEEAEAKCRKIEEAAKDQAEAAQKRMEELQSSFQATQEAFELELADLKKKFVELQDRHKNQAATIAIKSDELKEARASLQAANRKIAEEGKAHEDELTLKEQSLLAEQAKFLTQQEVMKSEHAKEKEQMVNDHQEEVSKVSADLRAAREAVQNLEASRKQDQERLERLNAANEDLRKRSVSIPDVRAAIMDRIYSQLGHSLNECLEQWEARATSLAAPEETDGSTQPVPAAADAQFQESLANGREEDLSAAHEDEAPWKKRRTRQPPGATILPTEEKKQLPPP
ncbi:ACAD11, partial [Symbiodinium sp. KB8]